MKGFSIDAQGVARADFDANEAMICWFLEQDIQSSQNVCTEYVTALEAVRSGQIKKWKSTGNAFTLTAKKFESIINAEYFDGFLAITTERLIECLKDWSRHIEKQQT